MNKNIARSHLNGDGRHKVRHRSIEEARLVAQEHEDRTGLQFNVYLCGICYHYHVGRKPRSYLTPREVRWVQSRDEALAGRVVHALRLVLDRSVEDDVDLETRPTH